MPAEIRRSSPFITDESLLERRMPSTASSTLHLLPSAHAAPRLRLRAGERRSRHQGVETLDNPNDFVRIEIAAALQRNIPVIPILLEGARIPKATQLPEDLKELSLRNGMEIRHASFQDDMKRLIRGLKGDGVYLAGEGAFCSANRGCPRTSL
jgi:hypothetical protein